MNRWSRLGICTPSRGLMHSRTTEAVMRNLERITPPLWKWFFSHDLPIPDCFNATVEAAVRWGADLIWIVEDDIVPPPPTFGKLLLAIRNGADIAVSDYLMPALGTGKLGFGVCMDGAGRVTWCRTGCILFKRDCLNDLPKPWFTLHNRLVKPNRVTWEHVNDEHYGADIAFTLAMFQLGFKFKVIDIMCNHLHVVEWGKARGSNHGFHTIEPYQEVQWQEQTGPMDLSRSVQPATRR